MTHTLSKVILPSAGDAEILPLYLRPGSADVIVEGRRSVRIPAGSTVSFGTYFNAFPAAYWRAWTGLSEVRATITARGAGSARVIRSDANGTHTPIAEVPLSEEAVSVVVPIPGSDDVGWIWFDIVAAATEVVLVEASWETDIAPQRRARGTIGITTFNKPDYCVANLTEIGNSADLREALERVIVVDQGERTVASEAGFETAAALLGESLAVVRQQNLGGSGGYARAMAETLAIDDADFVMFIDDDVSIEPEALRRAIVFSSYTTSPTIVGGHMLDLLDRTKLYAWAEVVDVEPFMWHAVDDERMPVDLAESDLRDTAFLHRRQDADYNGWWMCLIPRSVIEAIGLPLPVFIKWDDAEYGIRAAARGFPTVSLPGAALWHISWVGKDDQFDWQAYFHARNRIVAALLHSDRPHGGTLLTHSRRADLKHLLAMQYYPVALRHRALEAVLSGPDHLHRELAGVLSAARDLAGEFDETRPSSLPGGAVPAWSSGSEDMPGGLRLRLFMAWTLVRLWFHRSRPAAAQRPELTVTAGQAKWWRLAVFDSVLVRMAASGAAHLYVRDRDRHRRMMRESGRLHRSLHRRWAELAREYRASDIVSERRWASTFAGAGGPIETRSEPARTPGSKEPLR
jgi:galactofuranosylgalactofuranosylrhamnosyl-N-acetylglucosaminyl-diphospho-decaprenol beta-1,5/1,6-galactofuranosyltransferase